MGSITIFRRKLLLNKKHMVHLQHDVAHKTYCIRESRLHRYFLNSNGISLSRRILPTLWLLSSLLLIFHVSACFPYAAFDFLLRGLRFHLLKYLMFEEWRLLEIRFLQSYQ